MPLIRRKLARDRQSMLSTMILMGLQRVVVDDGLLQASIDLRVDARSLAERTQGEQLDTRVDTEASGSFGTGMWGASAKLAATVGYVKSDEQYTREDIAVSAGLRSSVQVRFHTEPLDTHRMASDSSGGNAQGTVDGAVDREGPDRLDPRHRRDEVPDAGRRRRPARRRTMAEAVKARERAAEAEKAAANPGENTAENSAEKLARSPPRDRQDGPADPKGQALAAVETTGPRHRRRAAASRRFSRTTPAGTARAPIREVTT